MVNGTENSECLSKSCSFEIGTYEIKLIFNQDLTSCEKMFKDTKFKEINMSKFDTKDVTSMSRMFHNCQKLNSLDLSNFDKQ